jgi:hypothetical protein
MASDAEIH